MSKDNNQFTKAQQNLLCFCKLWRPPSSLSKILNAFESYLQYITRNDGLKYGQKVYELVLYQAKLNSFPP